MVVVSARRAHRVLWVSSAVLLHHPAVAQVHDRGGFRLPAHDLNVVAARGNGDGARSAVERAHNNKKIAW